MTLPALRADARHPVAVYLAGRAGGSRRALGQSLRTITDVLTAGHGDVEALPWATLRYEHVAVVRAALLGRQLSPATVNRHLAALRGVLRECAALGLMPEADYQRIALVRGVPNRRLPAGHALEADHIGLLWPVVQGDHTCRGHRDCALLGLLLGGGLRCREVVSMSRVSCTTLPDLKFTGKGGRQRLVCLPQAVAQAVAAWIAGTPFVPLEGPVFTRLLPDGSVTGQRLHVRSVAKILARRCREAGIPVASPHDLRRTYCSELLARGNDPLVVARLMGHASPRETLRYDRRGIEALQQAAGTLTSMFS